MDSELTPAFRAQLLELKASLEAIAESSQEASKPVALDQTTVGRVSRIDAIRAQQMSMEAERRRQQQLRGIDGALRRIDAGTFGECPDCGEDISTGRLKANPIATKCINCAD